MKILRTSLSPLFWIVVIAIVVGHLWLTFHATDRQRVAAPIVALHI